VYNNLTLPGNGSPQNRLQISFVQALSSLDPYIKKSSAVLVYVYKAFAGLLLFTRELKTYCSKTKIYWNFCTFCDILKMAVWKEVLDYGFILLPAGLRII